jgi:hypothetical protein
VLARFTWILVFEVLFHKRGCTELIDEERLDLQCRVEGMFDPYRFMLWCQMHR